MYMYGEITQIFFSVRFSTVCSSKTFFKNGPEAGQSYDVQSRGIVRVGTEQLSLFSYPVAAFPIILLVFS